MLLTIIRTNVQISEPKRYLWKLSDLYAKEIIMQGFINVREEPITDEELKNQIIHDYRLRKNLDNVDYSKNKYDIHGRSLEAMREIVKKIDAKHESLYKKNYKRSINRKRTRSHKRGVITFPAHYQAYYEQGKFSDDDLIKMFKAFAKAYEAKTGKTIYNYVLHSRSEKTLHFHYYATNFDKEGKTKIKKGTGSALQDIAGECFSSIGLRRGIPKETTKAKHLSSREHYIEVLQQAEIIEKKLEAETITAEEVQHLADFATKPLKTMLIYVKRALDLTAEANKIKKNQERALNKMHEVLPQVNNIKDFEHLIDYIAANQQQLRTNNFKPTKGI